MIVEGAGELAGGKNTSSNMLWNAHKSKITHDEIKVSKIPNQTYTGSEITIDKLTVSDGRTPLVLHQDYELLYINNQEIGKVSISIRGTLYRNGYYRDRES